MEFVHRYVVCSSKVMEFVHVLFIRENLLATVHIWKWSFKTGNFVLLFTKQGGLWLGMTGGLSTQVKMNVKPIGAFTSGLIRQMVFERRGLKIQGPLYW